MSRNRVIGAGGNIPWQIPDELKWFRHKTFNSVVIMGRRTFEALPRPLEGRVNVVLTRHPARLRADEKRFAHALVGRAAHRFRDVAQLTFPQTPRTRVWLVRDLGPLARAGITEHAWLCGGAQLYRQFLAECSELYLSVVDREVGGDTLFPPFEHLFDLVGAVAEFAEFRVLRYVRRDTASRHEEPRLRPDRTEGSPPENG
ncbi:MAG TPA: dihydrofolate reductase [Anaeromyxobacteraceae bacterium]|nr:dihydrofolate reductase [Anaeromyxobacteraceae bacterium]